MQKINSERVRDAWKKSGLSYRELSALTKIPQNTLACYITGKRNPTDITTNVIEEIVNAYLNDSSVYINKTLYRDKFMESVPIEIMKAFDALPSVIISTKDLKASTDAQDGSERAEKEIADTTDE